MNVYTYTGLQGVSGFMHVNFGTPCINLRLSFSFVPQKRFFGRETKFLLQKRPKSENRAKGQKYDDEANDADDQIGLFGLEGLVDRRRNFVECFVFHFDFFPAFLRLQAPIFAIEAVFRFDEVGVDGLEAARAERPLRGRDHEGRDRRH